MDPLREDTLGRLALTLDGVRRRDRLVIDEVQARGVPLVLTMGGGYGRPLETTLEAHLGTYREACRLEG